MRIAIVHSFYRSSEPSGENQVVLRQVAALASAGHDVHLVSLSSDDEFGSRSSALAAAGRVATGFGRSPLDELRSLQPDLVHVHNLFPNFATRWAKHSPAPLVTTLHNFRPLCAAGVLYRDGFACIECPEHSSWRAVRHGCYRNSPVATIPLALASARGLQGNPLLRASAAVVVLSERAAHVYGRFGVSGPRVHTVPNFVEGRPMVHAPPKRSGWLFAGRLTEEKGVLDLVRSWPEDESLDIVGTGPLEADLASQGGPSVRLLGGMPRDDLLQRLPTYEGLLIPSRCFEGLPTVYLEALAAGVPVITTEGNSAADAAALEGTGVILDVVDSASLRSAFNDVREHSDRYIHQARNVFRSKYTEAAWLEAMLEVYSAVVGGGAQNVE